jgi:translation initiation factor IF-2
MLATEQVEEVIGRARGAPDVQGLAAGHDRGCMVTSGVVTRGRAGAPDPRRHDRHDGRIGTLRRFQDDVREVQQGFECGVTIDGYNDVKEGDVLEVYTVREVARTA